MSRSPDLRRSLLFVSGADAASQAAALAARPDVLVQDLEDFTPASRKPEARGLTAGLLASCRAAGILGGVRINDFDQGGLDDLVAAVLGGARLILIPKAETGRQIADVARELDRLEASNGMRAGATEIVPTAETARGVVNIREMADACPRVTSAVLGAEDLAADLVAERGADGIELAYARSRFLLEARAAGIEPIDAPYTFSDADGCAGEARRSRRLGYRSKSTVTAAHVAVLHAVLTPSAEDIAKAERIVEAFAAARGRGEDRALVDGLWIEPPAYANAQRLIARAMRLADVER